MNNTYPGQDLVLFSQDSDFLNTLFSGAAQTDAASPKLVIEKRLDVDRLQHNAGLVVYDLGFVDNKLPAAVADLQNIKQANPELPIILIGERPVLTDALQIEGVGTSISRSYSKPVIASKLMMAHEVLAAKPPQTIAESANIRNKIPLVTAALLGTMALIAVAVFLQPSDKTAAPPVSENVAPAKLERTAHQEKRTSVDTTEIDRLNKLASKALDDGRLILPDNDNALHYFERALKIDDYNDIAYKGRQHILHQLRKNFPTFLNDNDVKRTNMVIAILERLEPFSEDIQKMRDALTESASVKDPVAIETVQSGSRTEAVTTRKVEVASDNSVATSATDATNALRSQLVSEIHQAIQSGLLAPPQSNNAFALLRSAIKKKQLNAEDVSLIRKRLAKALALQASNDLRLKNIDQARIKVAYIEQLDRNNEGLNQLIVDIRTEQNRLAIAARPNPPLEDKARPATEITAPELVERIEPIYPSRAFKFDVEGWVELEYRVDENGNPGAIKVINSAPNKMFNKAAIDALKQWKFTPAKDRITGQALPSDTNTTKFIFSLGT